MRQKQELNEINPVSMDVLSNGDVWEGLVELSLKYKERYK